MSNTNSRFILDVNRIVRVQQANSAELEEIKIEPIAATRGIGETVAKSAKQSASIASPLKEIVGSREYYDPQLLKSSDGLFVIEQQAIKRLTFEDANGEKVMIEFSEK